MPKLERMLVPVDFSPCSGAALDWAAFLAEPLELPIDVLHVIRQPPAWPGAEVMVARAFQGREGRMIVLAALFGGLAIRRLARVG